MRTLSNNFGSYLLYLSLALFTLGFTSCNGDDDVDDIIDPDEPTGSIVAVDQTITNNTIVVQTVTVGQDSWLVAVMTSEEDTNNFITDMVSIEEGVNSNVELTLDENANLTGGEAGTEITLKLFADNPDAGTQGVFDPEDDEIMDENGAFARETITVIMEDNRAVFGDFDQDADGFLNRDEFDSSFPNNFSDSDTDADGFLNEDEFNVANFGNADANDDGFVDDDEFNSAATGLFGNYVGDDDFGNFDTDGDGVLSNDEFGVGFSGTDLFGNYDVDDDDNLTDTELNDGFFGDLDTNADGMIDEDEFNVYNTYTSTWI